MWDGGSTLSLITFEKAAKLHLPGRDINLKIVKVGGIQEEIKSKEYELTLHDKTN